MAKVKNCYIQALTSNFIELELFRREPGKNIPKQTCSCNFNKRWLFQVFTLNKNPQHTFQIFICKRFLCHVIFSIYFTVMY